jgi:hypothetical protein
MAQPTMDDEVQTYMSNELHGDDSQDETEEQEQVPDAHIEEFRKLLIKFGMEEQPNRRQELIRAREARYFWRGYQYPLFNSDQSTWIVPQEGGLPYSTNGGDAEGNNRFYYVENFYTSLGKSMVASLCGTAPEVVFLPCNTKEIDDIKAAKEAEKYKKCFYHNIDISQVLKDMARYFWTDGRTIGRIKQVTDAKYGYNEDGTPKTAEIIELGGVLEWKVPITARDKSEFHYASYSHEISTAQAKDRWKDKADKIKAGMSGPASDQFDRLCRLSILQGTDSMYAGDTYAHVVTICEVWIRPCVFMLLPKGIREEMQEKYPRGVRVTFAGNEFMEAVEESMDDVIEVCLPQPGDGQAVASLGEFVIPIQKMHNNKKNLSQEAWEKGTPLKFVDSKAVAEEGMTDQLASPEVYMPIKNPYPQQPLANCFYKEQQPMQAQDMIASLKDDFVNAQTISSVQPSLFGGSMVNAKTAAVYSQARDQALGALSITYGPMKAWLANITEKAVMLAEQREEAGMNDMVPDSGSYIDLSVDFDALRAGHYKCKPVVDDGGIPESPSAQKSGLMQMIQFMGQNPQFQQLLQHPDNQYFFKMNTGLKGFEIPGADSRNKQLREIEEMHKNYLDGQKMIAPDQADIEKVAQHDTIVQAAGGQSSNPQPSDMMQSTVPVDPEVDDNPIEAAECKRWLNSDEGQQAKQFERGWYDDVRQHMIEHQRAATQGPEAAKPVQDRIPNPAQAQQAAAVQGAMADHAQASAPQPPTAGNGGPPPAPAMAA